MLDSNVLLEKVTGYKTACQSLIENLREYQELIKENVPYEYKSSFGLMEIKPRQGSSWWSLAYDGNELPSFTKEIGKGYYVGGDFNYWQNYMTKEQLMNCAKNLKAKYEKALEKMDEDVKSILELNSIFK